MGEREELAGRNKRKFRVGICSFFFILILRNGRGWFGVSTLVKSSVNGFVRIGRIAKLYSKILEI